jgi:hypothetical protein
MPIILLTFFFVCQQSKLRICKSGAGREANLGKCDTPGFPLLDKPEIKYDHRGSLKLYMPRNHRRINQTSMDLLQSWRGNCDIQILVYNYDPMHPDWSEIAKVSDYVVAYASKGNTTLKEEREQTRRLLLA